MAREFNTSAVREMELMTFGVVEDKLLGTPKLPIIRSL